jgi:hypothetical protein
MPSEVSDIKQFIEICRRKDAQCTCRAHYTIVPGRAVQKRRDWGRRRRGSANSQVGIT